MKKGSKRLNNLITLLKKCDPTTCTWLEIYRTLSNQIKKEKLTLKDIGLEKLILKSPKIQVITHKQTAKEMKKDWKILLHQFKKPPKPVWIEIYYKNKLKKWGFARTLRKALQRIEEIILLQTTIDQISH